MKMITFTEEEVDLAQRIFTWALHNMPMSQMFPNGYDSNTNLFGKFTNDYRRKTESDGDGNGND